MDMILERILKESQEWSRKQMALVEASSRHPTPLPPLKTYKIQGSGNNIYTLSVRGTQKTCSCPGFVYRRKCKHTWMWTPSYGRL